jgi:hypothetical protein
MRRRPPVATRGAAAAAAAKAAVAATAAEALHSDAQLPPSSTAAGALQLNQLPPADVAARPSSPDDLAAMLIPGLDPEAMDADADADADMDPEQLPGLQPPGRASLGLAAGPNSSRWQLGETGDAAGTAGQGQAQAAPMPSPMPMPLRLSSGALPSPLGGLGWGLGLGGTPEEGGEGREGKRLRLSGGLLRGPGGGEGGAEVWDGAWPW